MFKRVKLTWKQRRPQTNVPSTHRFILVHPSYIPVTESSCHSGHPTSDKQRHADKTREMRNDRLDSASRRHVASLGEMLEWQIKMASHNTSTKRRKQKLPTRLGRKKIKNRHRYTGKDVGTDSPKGTQEAEPFAILCH